MTKLPMVCALGAVLLMAGCVSQKKYDESQQKNAELEQQYQQLNQAMGAEVAAHNVKVTRMRRTRSRFSVNSQLLFPSLGDWEMPDAAKTSIAEDSRDPGTSSDCDDQRERLH